MDRRAVVNPDPRRLLPQVGELLRQLSQLHPELPEWALKAGIRRGLAELRAEISDRPEALEGLDEAALRERLAARGGSLALRSARRSAAGSPRGVINATGVVLHTNLGRAPLADGAARAAADAAAGYSDLELDLESGRRGNRLAALSEKLELLTGAEGGYACNNNAAAIMLALDTLGRGREVIVSRGELVEIGGSFRVPDIMERAGVTLVEVGTTNRTHPRDYEAAIGPETALLLKVHRSNFELRGFTTEVGIDELAAIGARHGLPVVEDLGSGTLVDLTPHGFPPESFVPSRLELGADVVCFSGDKLLGGPQAGIAIGKAAMIDAMRGNPLARSLRLDKLSLAALDWTLGCYLAGDAEQEIPALRQLLTQAPELEARAQALAGRLEGVLPSAMTLRVEQDDAPVGGGSLPELKLGGYVVTLQPGAGERSAKRLAEALRAGEPPLIARVRDGVLVLDVRTLRDRDLQPVCKAVERVLAKG